MLITPDFSQVSRFTMIPEGTHKARIADVQPKTSAAGNSYLSVVMEAFGSPEVNGKKLYVNAPTGGKAAWILEGVMKAAGLDTNTGFDTVDLIGKVVLTDVRHEVREGKTYATVKNVFKASDEIA